MPTIAMLWQQKNETRGYEIWHDRQKKQLTQQKKQLSLNNFPLFLFPQLRYLQILLTHVDREQGVSYEAVYVLILLWVGDRVLILRYC